MTETVERLAVRVVRLIISIFLTTIALLITAWILPGVEFVATPLGPSWLQAVAAAVVIGLINMLLRPVLLYISRPLGFFLLFLVGLVLNVLALLLTSWLLNGFILDSLFITFIASLVIAAVNVILAGILNLGDEDSYYRRRTESKAAETPFPMADEPGRKLVMLEIDGLSYHHMNTALAQGWMPGLRAMMEEEGYQLSLIDCGIPSQTSACQAGIMFGDNDDIPAFRWFDKTEGKLIVSSSDAPLLNERYANGNGLMRGGSSVSNMLNGDAYKSLMTAADLMQPESEEAKRRANDVYLLMLDPSFLISTIARFLGMVGVELWEGWQQRRNNVWPRLNRLAHFYPFVRAATSVALRDLGAAFATMDILRGSPSIYVTWPGYDEVAHHSGPWTKDAFRDLTRYDRVITHIRRTIKEKARGHYDLLILSDHGQSFGPTFLQRYGVSVKELIEQQLPEGTSVTTAIGGDTGSTSITTASAELANSQQQGESTRLTRQIVRGSNRLAEAAMTEEQARVAASIRPANVTAYGSGNLAQVYFDLFPRKITLRELNAAYPGMVDALVNHEGIGLVCGYQDDGTPIAIGKGGTRDLHTGEVTGEDPLRPYAPAEGPGASTVEIRAWQTRRVMDFRHAGDLMLISTIYPDGTVAALEELIGSHGGLGGEQTDAFIFHPADMAVTATRNAIDVFHILNNHRGSPLPPPRPAAEPQPTRDWQPRNLWAGVMMPGVWLRHIGRCAIPDRSAFRGVIDDPLMTGPAIVLAALSAVAHTLVVGGATLSDVAVAPVRVLGVFLSALIMFGVGFAITDSGSYARTFRAVAFAQSPNIFLIFALYQPLAHVVVFIVIALTVTGVWIGSAVAHNVPGWRSVLLPLLYILIVTVGVTAVLIILGGTVVSLYGLLQVLGVLPGV
jgi:uncharacterized membrane protein YvlD (DUF360 family)